jgi:hypothetical protein
MVEQEGAGVKGHHIVRCGIGPMHCGKRASKCLLRQKECEGHQQARSCRGRCIRTQKESIQEILIGWKEQCAVKLGTVASIKLGLLGCSRTCSRRPSIVIIGSGMREEWL